MEKRQNQDFEIISVISTGRKTGTTEIVLGTNNDEKNPMYVTWEYIEWDGQEPYYHNGHYTSDYSRAFDDMVARAKREDKKYKPSPVYALTDYTSEYDSMCVRIFGNEQDAVRKLAEEYNAELVSNYADPEKTSSLEQSEATLYTADDYGKYVHHWSIVEVTHEAVIRELERQARYTEAKGYVELPEDI